MGGSPKDENSGDSDSYLRKGFNFTKRLVSTSSSSVWNSSNSAVKSSYNWMSGKTTDKDTNNNKPVPPPTKESSLKFWKSSKPTEEPVSSNEISKKEDSQSYLQKAASYSANTSVGIYNWAFGKRNDSTEGNGESRAKSLANTTISGINSSLGFTKSVVTGTYGYIFSNNKQSSENDKAEDEPNTSTGAYIKDLTIYGLSSSWGLMKAVGNGTYGLFVPSDSEKHEIKDKEVPDASTGSEVTSLIKDYTAWGLSSSWNLMKAVGNGTYGLFVSSDDRKPEPPTIVEEATVLRETRKSEVKVKTDDQKPEPTKINRNASISEKNLLDSQEIWPSEVKVETPEETELSNESQKVQVTKDSNQDPEVSDKEPEPSKSAKIEEEVKQSDPWSSVIWKGTKYGLSSSWSLLKTVGNGASGILFSSKNSEKNSNKLGAITFDKIKTNSKFANFNIKNLPAGRISVEHKKWWTEMSHERFPNYLQLDGLAILKKISIKDEPKPYETIKEYGKWWNELGNGFHQNFTFTNVETDSIVKKYFYYRSSHHQNKFGFDIPSTPAPRQHPLYRKYMIYRKFPTVSVSVYKTILRDPSLHRVKKQIKYCKCQLLEFPDCNFDVKIDDIEIYDKNAHRDDFNSTIFEEEELRTNIFRLKVLLGLAVVYMIVKI